MAPRMTEARFIAVKRLMEEVPIKPGESRKSYFDRLKKINQTIPCKDKLYAIYAAADYTDLEKKGNAPADKQENDLAAAYRFLRDQCIEVEINDMKHLIITMEVSKWESLF